MQFYHGTDRSRLQYSQTGGESDEPDMLFASASPLVAERYGKRLFELELLMPESALPKISVMDWVWGKPIPSCTFIIEPHENNPDFPVATLVVRDCSDVRIRPA